MKKIKPLFRSGETIRRYVENYKFKSLFIKNTLYLMLLIAIPLLGIVSISYFAYRSMQKNEVKAQTERITIEYFTEWENILKEAKTQLGYIGFNSNVELFMHDVPALQQLNYQISNIQELILMPIVTKEYIDSIYIYSEKSGKVITVNGVSNYDTFSEKSLLEDYLSGNSERNIYITELPENPYYDEKLSLFHEIKYGPKTNGLAVMNLNIQKLSEVLTQPGDVKIYLTDGKTVLFSSEEEMIGEPVETVRGYGQIQHGKTAIWGGYVISSMLAQQADLEVIAMADSEQYRDQLATVRNFMILFMLVIVLLTIVLSVGVSVRIFRPIGDIVSSLQKYQNVLVGESEQFHEKDELEYILNSIQKTVHIKNDIDRELAERVRLLKKAQSVALQSQINPHFLNNTLETINWMAIGLLGGKNEISEMTMALSKMLRMALANTDTIIPMSVEIEHCMNYLEIQKKRYEDKFDVLWKLPKEIYQCKTIRIILQPIVENAIYHGIKPLSIKGRIIISGSVEDNLIELRVTDNGLGMTAEELEELRKSIRSDVIKESRHIGVANVNQRIKLYFGDEYGVFVDSKEGMGTTVKVWFPKITS